MSHGETFCSFCLRDTDPDRTFSLGEGERLVCICYECVLVFADFVKAQQTEKTAREGRP
jgi:hypothetical protein